MRKKLTSFSSDSDMQLSLGTTAIDDIMTPKNSHKVQESSHNISILKGQIWHIILKTMIYISHGK